MKSKLLALLAIGPFLWRPFWPATTQPTAKSQATVTTTAVKTKTVTFQQFGF